MDDESDTIILNEWTKILKELERCWKAAWKVQLEAGEDESRAGQQRAVQPRPDHGCAVGALLRGVCLLRQPAEQWKQMSRG